MYIEADYCHRLEIRSLKAKLLSLPIVFDIITIFWFNDTV